MSVILATSGIGLRLRLPTRGFAGFKCLSSRLYEVYAEEISSASGSERARMTDVFCPP